MSQTTIDTVVQAVLNLYLADPYVDLTVRVIAEQTRMPEDQVRAVLSDFYGARSAAAGRRIHAPVRQLNRYKVAVEVSSRYYPGTAAGSTTEWAYRPSSEWLAKLVVEARAARA